MFSIVRFSSFFTCFLLFYSCSPTAKIAVLKPEPDDDKPLAYESATSFISLPVSLKLKDIENQANKNVNGLIYEDNSLEKDNLILKVWKEAPFQVTNLNGKIRTVLPLKVAGTVRYGTSAFGMNLYDSREFTMSGIITLLSDASVSNWKLNTSTHLDKIDWTESPTVKLGGKSISLQFLIDPAVQLFKEDIEKVIDQGIKNASDFKPQVLSALEKISAPLLIDPNYQTWFRLIPMELYTTKSTLQGDAIALSMGLKCKMETFIGQKPKGTFNKNSVLLKPVESMPDKINLSVAAISSYPDASALMAKNFDGKEFKSGKRKVTVNKVELWHKGDKLIVSLDLSGSLNGTVYLSGIPKYDAQHQEIFVDNIDYVLDTKHRLTRGANWLLKGAVLKNIEDNCRYSITQSLADARKQMEPFLKNYVPVKGVLVNGTVDDLHFDNIQLSNKAIVAFINATGTMDVKIDGLE